MNNKLKKSITAALGATAAAVAAPALLFLGAGTAQAATTVGTTSDALGVTVHVQSTGSHGLCTYTATPTFTPVGKLKPLPVYGVPFHLQAGQNHNLWFPGIQTGSLWSIEVKCDNGPAPDSFDFHNAWY
ncbi:hypothetical protein [Mycobacterium hubeiense]|uniref:hypothetical protein n=1 Tax=Mycobacterium hubeiense TaxID=1867256 RepID=UPI000C7F277D|nr:hypothetical protein [Mycobacterium sp. QGD 101]